MNLDDLVVSEVSGEGASKKVDHIIERNHYLRSVPEPPTKHRFIIGFGLEGVVGAAAWGKPIARAEDQEDTIELLRFWTSDSTPKNTESKALGYMMRKMKEKGYDRMIAYASEGQNHDGTIYKATNWMVEKRFSRTSTWENRDNRVDRDKADKIKFVREVQ